MRRCESESPPSVISQHKATRPVRKKGAVVAASELDALMCIACAQSVSGASPARQPRTCWSSTQAERPSGRLAPERSACAAAMARTAVALLLLGLAYAQAQTYTLDLQQPQKVWRAPHLQYAAQPAYAA